MSSQSTIDPKKLSIAAVALAIVFFLSLNVLSGTVFRGVQLDLTKNRLFTLSDGTYKVLAEVKEPITLRLFLSQQLIETSPGLGTYASRVIELLQRYVSLSDGKITLEVIHPQQFSPEEDRAVGYQLQGIPVTDAGELGYFGLAGTNTTDDTDTIGFFSPQRERFLEYDLTRMINNLAHPKKKVIGIIGALPIEADPALQYKPWQVVEQLKQFFEIKSMGLSPENTDGVDLLMIVHPFGLDDKGQYVVDQFLLRGGKAMIFVDPYAEDGTRSNAAMRMPPDTSSDLKRLFEAWGIDYDRNTVLGDRELAQRVSAGLDPRGRPIITDYVAWITLQKEQMKSDDVVTGDLQLVNLASAGFFSKKDGATIDFEPLLMSTDQSGPVPADSVRIQPQPAQILENFKADGKVRVVAARLSGTLKTAFPDGPPKDKNAKDEEKPAPADGAKAEDAAKGDGSLKESVKPANIIIVADTDILADRSWLQIQNLFGQQMVVPTANNADFVFNGLDNLAGGGELISLRSRNVLPRSFTKVEDLKKSAEAKYLAKEQELQKKLKDVETKLRELQTKEQAGGTQVLSKEQQDAIAGFRKELVTLRRELRDVQLALRKDIENLGASLKVINIAAMPIIVALFAIGLALYRRSRERRHLGAPPSEPTHA